MAKAPLKRRIADAFMILVPQAPTRRVTVAELTRYLDIDRKTFYNHFDNIDNLMIWLSGDHARKPRLRRMGEDDPTSRQI